MALITFQVMSDLHLETPLARPTYDEFSPSITPQSPYLALLGDIGYASDSRLFTFLENQLRSFSIVFFLLGNHEAYGTTYVAAKANVEAFAARIEDERDPSSEVGRFVFLDQSRYDIDESMTILGCTLYSRISEEQEESVRMFVSDFSSIENWEVDDHNTAHESDLFWLNAQVQSMMEKEPERTIIIFTHHSPTLLDEANDPMHKDDLAQASSAFATDLSRETCWTSAQVKLWAFGHTHYNCDFVDPLTKKRVFTNQKGYRRSENVTFDAAKTVQVEMPAPAEAAEKRKSQHIGSQGSTSGHESRRKKRQNATSKICTMM
jgi:Calcineurin-like phosphoesterase